VDLVEEQDEKISWSPTKLATFGIEPAVVFAALAQQNRCPPPAASRRRPTASPARDGAPDSVRR
jgi:hypothetical protein